MKATTFLPLFTGFYGSTWDDVDFYGEDEYYKLPDDKCFDDFVNWPLYHQAICKKMCEFIEGELRPFVSNIDFVAMHSPKFYNFENDEIVCEINFDKQIVQQYLLSNFEEFSAYIVDRYTSRDGFISYHSNDPFEWLDNWTNNDNMHRIGAVLNFILVNEGVEEPSQLDDIHVSLFYTDDINQYAIENE